MGPFSEGWTEEDVEAVIQRGDPEELLFVPIVVGMSAHDCEPGWAERVCLALVDHPNMTVRGNAVLGLGHVARTRGELDLQTALPAITRALSDESEYVRSHANNAACDVQIYMGHVVPGYDEVQTALLLKSIEEVRRKHDA